MTPCQRTRRRSFTPTLLIRIMLVTGGALAVAAGAASAKSPDGVATSEAIPAADTMQMARARVNLERHVDAARLLEFRRTSEAATAKALDFLFAWLPSSDLAAWRADSVIDDLRHALQVREASPWRHLISEEQFLTWVLPHRVAQEPIESWRRPLHDLLWPRVRHLSLREAILETNRFCREQATFIPTSARDQAPLTTMARGLGRCEEETILFVCAARSVGIPARVAWTPWWMSGDNNHAWVEAWDGGAWHYLGACEPAAELDQAWFTEPARRAGLVLSGAYGEAAVAGEEIYSRGRGVTLFNSTGVYTTPGRLSVTWTDRAGDDPRVVDSLRTARAGVRVTVHVVNSGTLIGLAEFTAADSITLGPGDYFISSEVDDRPAGSFIRIEPGRRTVAPLDPRRGEEGLRTLLAEPFRLRITTPTPPAARVDAPTGGRITAASLAALEDSLRRARTVEQRADSLRLAEYKERLGGRDSTTAAALIEVLQQVPRRAEPWFVFLRDTPGAEWRSAAAFVLAMDDKDLLEADTSSARAWVRELTALRPSAVPDSTWNAFVLSPRLDRQPYDPGLVNLPLFVDDGRLASARAIHARFAARVREADPTRLGHLATPSETWASGWATPAAARVALTGLLRRHGIPARVEPGRRWVEVWDEERWVPCDPLQAGSWDRREEEVARAYASPARLRVTFTEDDSLLAAAEPGRHFLLARFRDGRLEPDFECDYRTAEGELETDLEPGDWWLFGVLRDADGSPRVRAQAFTAISNREIEFGVDLGPRALSRADEPAARVEEDDRPAPRPESEGQVSGCVDPSPWWLSAVQAIGADYVEPGRPSLIGVWERGAEPTIRVQQALRDGIEEIRRAGVIVCAVYTESASSEGDAEEWTPDLPDEIRHLLDQTEVMNRFGRDPRLELPFILLRDEGGTPRLCLSGLRLDAADALRRAVRATRPR